MPNWCNTRMTITGSKEECERFVAGVQHEEVEEKIYDWTTSPVTETGTKMVTHLSIFRGYLPCPQELYEINSPVREEQAELAQQMQEKYGCTNWYDWQHNNWGVKWGDCHTHILDESDNELPDGSYKVDYQFDTAWGTADDAFLKISAMFPTLRFDFFHDEEAGFFQGCQVMKNGELVYERYFAPCEYKVEAPDWDSPEYDEWSEAHDKWRHAEQFKIDSEVDKVVC